MTLERRFSRRERGQGGGNNSNSPNTTPAQINNLRGNAAVLASRETPGQSGRWLLDKQRWLLMLLRNAKFAAAAWFLPRLQQV